MTSMSSETELQENPGREVQLVNAKADMEQASPHFSTLPPQKMWHSFPAPFRISAAPGCPRRSKQQQLVAMPRSRAKLKPQNVRKKLFTNWHKLFKEEKGGTKLVTLSRPTLSRQRMLGHRDRSTAKCKDRKA